MKKEYNVRLIVDGDKLELGFVYGLYAGKPERLGKKKIKVKEWKSVPDSVKEKLAKKIGAKIAK